MSKLHTYPAPLRPGDKIAIVSPATAVREEYISGAADFIREKGYEPVVMPHAAGPSSGTYATTHANRLQDFKDALSNPDIKAILCARGGYGCVHLMADRTLAEMVARSPKWLVGFSDVSALHALWHRAGVASIHGPMAKHLTTEPAADFSSTSLFRLLSGDTFMDYETAPHKFNRLGEAVGELRGGNLAVLNGLSATPFDILSVGEGEDVVLFIEDISEAIYAVERMLMRLQFSGTILRLKGLIVGQFTEYRPDRNFSSMEEMIDAFLTRHEINHIPVAFNFPVGHVSRNYPLVEGAFVELTVTQEKVTLKTCKK